MVVDITTASAPLFEEFLLEIMLAIILSFNVGAYVLLWDMYRGTVEEIEALEKDVGEITEKQTEIKNSIYGSSMDDTNRGHIVETEDQMEEFKKQLNKSDIERKREHKEVKVLLLRLIDRLQDEKDIDLDIDVDEVRYGD